jgi:hypothetical protein
MKHQAELFDLTPRGMTDVGEADRLTLGQLAEAIGHDAAIAFGKAFAGTRIYIPLHIVADHVIAREIGAELAARLGARFGGECIDIPLLKSRGERQADRKLIADLRRQGFTVAEVARAVGCSERHVYNVLRQ